MQQKKCEGNCIQTHGEHKGEVRSVIVYIIEEYTSNGVIYSRATWRSCNFAPLSDIDETELVKERELLNQ